MEETYEEKELKIILTPKFVNRFWSKVKKQPNGCWEWQKSLVDGRYGQVRVGGKEGKIRRCHQVAYAIHHQEPISGLIRHKVCNNGKCCNPEHLMKGTHTENMDDMFNALRHFSQPEEKTKQIKKAVKELTLVEMKLLYEILSEEIKHNNIN